MSEVRMMLDDPELTHRSPGKEFALAHARHGPKAAVELRRVAVVTTALDEPAATL